MSKFAGIVFGVDEAKSLTLMQTQLSEITKKLNEKPIEIKIGIGAESAKAIKDAATATVQLASAQKGSAIAAAQEAQNITNVNTMLKQSEVNTKGAAGAKRQYAVETAHAVAVGKAEIADSKTRAQITKEAIQNSKLRVQLTREEAQALAAQSAAGRAETASAKQREASLNRLIAAQQQLVTWGRTWSELKSNPALYGEYTSLTASLEQMRASGTATAAEMDKLTLRVKQFGNTTRAAGANAMSLGDKFVSSFAKFGVWLSASTIMMSLVTQVKKVISSVIELDSYVVDLQIATGKTRNEVKGLISDYIELGKQLGASGTDVAAAADTFLRQGKTLAETQTLIKNATMLSKLGQIEAAEASQALTSAMKGYNLTVEESIGVIDKFTAVDMVAAVSAGDIATAMAETAVGAEIAGIAMDRLTGYITVVKEISQDGAESVGTFYRTLFARMGNIKAGRLEDFETGESLSDVETVLDTYSIKLRDSNEEFRNFGDVLDEVASRWDSFGTVGQRAIAVAFSGTRQQEKFLTLMEYYEQAMEYAEIAANSAGNATEKYNTYLDGVEASQERFVASFQALSMGIVNSDFIKGTIDTGSGILGFFTKLNELTGSAPNILSLIGGVAGYNNLGILQSTQSGIGLNWVGKTDINLLNQLSATLKGVSDEELVSERNNLLLQDSFKGLSNSGRAAALTIDNTGKNFEQYGLAAKAASVGTKLLNAALNALIVFAVSFAIQELIKWIQSYSKSIEDAAETSRRLTEEFAALDAQAIKIDELIQKLNSGNLSIEDAAIARQDLMSVQDQIISKYDVERGAIDGVTDSIYNQIDAIKQQEAAEWWQENQIGYGRAVDTLTRTGLSFNNLKPNTSLLSEAEQIRIYSSLAPLAQEAGLRTILSTDPDNQQYGGKGEITTFGTLDEQLEQLRTFFDLLEKYKKTDAAHELMGAIDSEILYKGISLDKISDRVSEAILDITQNADYISAKATVDEGTKYLIAYDETYRELNAKVVAAQKTYNEAIASGNQDTIDAATQSLVGVLSAASSQANGISDVFVQEYFKNLVAGLREQAAKANFDTGYADLTSGSNPAYGQGRVDSALSDLSEYTNTELASESFKDLTGVTYEQIAAFNLLASVAEALGVPFEYLISQLRKTKDDLHEAADAYISVTEAIEDAAALDAAKDTFDAFSDAIDEFNEQGYISAEVLTALQEIAPELVMALMDESGAFDATKIAALNSSDAIWEAIIASAQMALAAAQANFQALVDQYGDLETAARNAAGEMWNAAVAAVAVAQGNLDSLNDLRSAGYGGSKKSSGGGGSSSIYSKDYIAAKEYTEHMIKLSELRQKRMSDESDAYEAESQTQIAYYQSLLDSTAQELQRLRAKGYSESNKEYRQLLQDYESYQNAVYDIAYAAWQQQQQAAIKAIEKQIDAENERWKAREKQLDHEIDLQQSLLELEKTYLENIDDIHKEIASLDKELASALAYPIGSDLSLFTQDEHDDLVAQLRDIEEQATAMYEGYQNKLSQVTAENSYELEGITDEFERQYELLLKQYEISKADLAVARARRDLESVLNERNVAMLVNGVWTWVADPESVKAAVEAVYDAQADAEDALADLHNTLRTQALEEALSNIEMQKAVEEAAHDAIIEGLQKQIEAIEAMEFVFDEFLTTFMAGVDAMKSMISSATGSGNKGGSGDSEAGGSNGEDLAALKSKLQQNAKYAALNELLEEDKKAGSWTNGTAGYGSLFVNTKARYASGGIADFTGLAKMDGQPNAVETIFNSTDGAKLYNLVHNTPDLVASWVDNLLNALHPNIATRVEQVSNSNSKSSTVDNSKNFYFPNGLVIQGSDAELLAAMFERHMPLQPV